MCQFSGSMTVVSDYLLQSIVLIDYINWNVWLLPLLRIIVGWGKATGIVGSDLTCLLDPLVLCYMTIGFCLDLGLLYRVDVSKVRKPTAFFEYCQFSAIRQMTLLKFVSIICFYTRPL